MRKTSAFAKISVNSVCNLKCRMCDVGQKNLSSGLTSNFLGRTDIRPMEWMKIFKRLNIKHVYIQGTEPLLYDGIDELLELTHTAGILVTLTTNGWLLNKHASSLVKNNVNVWVSIDGLKLTHDKIRGVDGSYDKAMAGIEILKSKSLKNIYVSFAVTPDNTADIIPLYKILDSMKISMMANHYNFISSTSCADYNCTPVNISYYNPSDVNIEEIHKSIIECKNLGWLPAIRDLNKLERYYRFLPTACLLGKKCNVLNQIYSGKRYVIASDGELLISARCWIKAKLGDAFHNTTKNSKVVLEWINRINAGGLPPPCQRLCCGGLTV